ncbi:MAG: molybdenum cofactor guanylyltransferase MobA [Acetobacteraceae bacterium]|nr:molybdenum cofactor guanylyltransferase MobA [Acetobacteraceae bacterium]
MPPDPTVALVLAGGEARRMGGGDKPLLDVGGQAILAHILAVLAPLPVAISANGDPHRFAATGCPVLGDGAFVGEGPLAGVLAGLDWAAGRGAQTLLTVPGDTPFVPPDLVRRLAPAPACAASLGRRHPLVALWPVACRGALRAWLALPGPRAVTRFAESIGMRAVDFPVQSGDPFLNVNTPEELMAARSRVAGPRAEPRDAG